LVKFVHGLLAALGYYPSKDDIENMHNEVKFSKYSDTYEKTNVDSIDFETFVKIYINHRPYKELEMLRIEKAFTNIKNNQTNTKTVENSINRDFLINCLKEYGEKMDDKEIAECLGVLTGDPNIKSLPEFVTFEELFYRILRFEPIEEEEEVEENK
jgi:hypothetical protein